MTHVSSVSLTKNKDTVTTGALVKIYERLEFGILDIMEVIPKDNKEK